VLTNSYVDLGYRTLRILRRLRLPSRTPFLSTIGLVILAAVALPAARAQSDPPAKELHIAAASDLQPVLPTLAAAYEKATGVHIIPSFGSSATLAQQIESGAPVDLFLSADTAHAQQLVAASLAFGLTGSAPTPYARGILVLWARKDSPAQPLTLDSLSKPSVQKIAVANDQHAPYGLAATAALKSLHLYDRLQPRLVVAENISQTAQFAESGNAQVALISLTIASSPHFRDLGTFIRIPASAYPELRQSGVVLKSSRNHAAAQAFLRWLTSPKTQSKLSTFGLDPAD
jgi:molybdate transport system substrate-binding protein